MEQAYNTNRKNKHGYDRFNFYYKLSDGVVIDTTKKILISVPSGIINDYIVPDGIEIILDNAFEGCTFINKILLPQSLKALGNNCFKDCYALNELHIPAGVEYIAPRCFLYSSITKVSFGGNRFRYFNNAIYNNKKVLIALFGNFRKYVLPPSVTGIGNGVFYSIKALEEVDLTNLGNLDMLSESMFAQCISLCKVCLPSNINSIPNSFFSGCLSLNLDLSKFDDLRRIGDKSFMYTSSSTLTLPDKLEHIGDHAFSYTSLHYVEIPESVHYIDRWAFAHCPNLFTIKILGKDTIIATCVFDESCRLREVVINDKLDLGFNMPTRWGFHLSEKLRIIRASDYDE